MTDKINKENSKEMKKINIINEDNKKKVEYINDMCEAPTLKEGKFYYNCSECSSPIEIIFIDEENIEFKCINKYQKK